MDLKLTEKGTLYVELRVWHFRFHLWWGLESNFIKDLAFNESSQILNTKFWNFWKFGINRFSHIVEWRCSENNAACSQDTCQSEQPQKQSIQNHGNKFPIFYYLIFMKEIQNGLSISRIISLRHFEEWLKGKKKRLN